MFSVAGMSVHATVQL